MKTALHLLTPGGFGYIRKLRKMRDPGYVHERDKHEVRKKHHGGGGWKTEKDGDVLKRDYTDYEEYLTHQKQKLDELIKMKGGFSNWDISEYRLKFYARFRHLTPLLPKDAVILCCGARQGTEVEVLRDLGFSKAIGLDLNPGPDNPYVKPGDFMRLDYADGTVDLVYTNCVDHAFDLDQMITEHQRVLKPDGFLLYDIGAEQEESHGAGVFEAISWDRAEDVLKRLLENFQTILHVEREPQWLWVLVRGKRNAGGHRSVDAE